MRILADTHVHFYSCFDFPTLVHSGLSHLRLVPERADVCCLCLTERSGQHVFQNLKANGFPSSEYIVKTLSDDHALKILGHDDCLYVIAGRQIVTAEQIEVLALTRDVSVPDGLSLKETVAAVCLESAVPVLPWSPGKWLFSRGKILQTFLGEVSAQELLIGDIFIRPTIWGEPVLMESARNRGLRVVAGSDPLPFPGDERVTGSYATYLEGAFDLEHPSSSLRALLLNEKVPLRSVGKRANVPTMLKRLLKNRLIGRRFVN